ncbi:MAG: hypothetical protein LBV17_04820 [Treponema sp.]|nr:hypothetical protein [Treponema sp.]
MKILFFLLSVLTFYNCCSREIIIKKIGDPIYSNYIKWELEITSERENDTIIPSFNVTLMKKTDDFIKFYKFRTLYYYGQLHDFSDIVYYEWTEEMPELIELNEKGFVTIRRTLPAMQREELIKKEKDVQKYFVYTDPDGENLEGITYKMIIVPK